MLENLSLGDEPKLVSSVKADGVEKSGLAASIDVLKAKCASKTEEEALAGLALVKSLSEGAKEAEPFTKECLTAGKILLQCVLERSYVHVAVNFVDLPISAQK